MKKNSTKNINLSAKSTNFQVFRNALDFTQYFHTCSMVHAEHLNFFLRLLDFLFLLMNPKIFQNLPFEGTETKIFQIDDFFALTSKI